MPSPFSDPPFSDPPVLSAGEQSVKRERIGPIRILDFFVLTTAIALSFFLSEMAYRLINAKVPNGWEGGVWTVYRLMFAIPTGLTIAGIYWLIYQKRTTGQFFRQPGHWVLALNAVVIVGQYGAFFARAQSGGMGFEEGSVWKYFLSLLFVEAIAVVVLWFGIKRAEGYWRWLFILLFLNHLIMAVAYLLWLIPVLQAIMLLNVFREFNVGGYLSLVAGGVGLLLLTMAVVSDRRRKVARDWLHGVALVLLLFNLVIEPLAKVVVVRMM